MRSKVKKIDIEEDVCRICLSGDGPSDMISPCNCSGSSALVHFKCLKSWIETSGHPHCSTCKGDYNGIKIQQTLPSYCAFIRSTKIHFFLAFIIILLHWAILINFIFGLLILLEFTLNLSFSLEPFIFVLEASTKRTITRM